MAAPPPPCVSRDQPSSPPPSTTVLPPSQHQHQEEEPGSESELELDSPPRLTIIIPEDEEPRTPTSPPASPRGGSPPLIDVGPTTLPSFGSDTEEWHSSDAEDDTYFKSLEDNFIISAQDVCKPLEDNLVMEAAIRRQSDKYAESALKYYNNDKNNKVKYDLISAITSCGIFEVKGLFGHVNFIAKGNQQNSKEELFFAELHLENDTFVPTIVLPLEGMKKVGGLCGSKFDKFNGIGFPIDAQHCYACGSRLKHPKNGALYEAGHVAVSDYYHG